MQNKRRKRTGGAKGLQRIWSRTKRQEKTFVISNQFLFERLRTDVVLENVAQKVMQCSSVLTDIQLGMSY